MRSSIQDESAQQKLQVAVQKEHRPLETIFSSSLDYIGFCVEVL